MKKPDYFLMGLLYAGIAVFFTWPLSLHLKNGFPSPAAWFGGDPNMYIWYINIIAKWVNNTSLNLSETLFYPGGVNFTSAYDGPLMLVFSVPLILIGVKTLVAYNLFIIFAIAVAALACFALAYHLTRSITASFLSGFAFGFSPYMLIRTTQHPNLILLFSVPLFALATIRLFESPSTKRALLFSLCVFVLALSSWYYLLASGIFFLVCAINYSKTFIDNFRSIFAAMIFGFLAVLLAALPLLQSSSQQIASYEFVSSYGLQLKQLVIPHPLISAFNSITQPIYNQGFIESGAAGRPQFFETTGYIGLLFLGLLTLFRKPTIVSRKQKILWGVTAAIFFVFALGPEISLAGRIIPLPFKYLMQIFPYSFFRVPNRFFVYTLLSASILFAYLWKDIFQKLRARTALLLFGLIFLALTIERLITPFPIFSHAVSDFYKTISHDKSDYAIADLPILKNSFSQYNYFQTIHGKPIVAGEFFYQGVSDNTFSFINNNDLLAGSICGAGKNLPVEERQKRTLEELSKNNIRYVVVHNFTFELLPECARQKAFIRDFFANKRPWFVDGELTVYKLY